MIIETKLYPTSTNSTRVIMIIVLSVNVSEKSGKDSIISSAIISLI